jgi:hypothetical protein
MVSLKNSIRIKADRTKIVLGKHDHRVPNIAFYALVVEELYFMYWRPILCTLYGAVDFLNVLKK